MNIWDVLQDTEQYHQKHIQIEAFLFSRKKDFYLSDEKILGEQKLLLNHDYVEEELIAAFEGKTDNPLLMQIWNAKVGVDIANPDAKNWGIATIEGQFKQVSAKQGELRELTYIHLKVSDQQEYFFRKGGITFHDILPEHRNLPVYSLQDIIVGSQDLSENKIKVEGWILGAFGGVYFATNDANVDDTNSILLSTINLQSEFWKLHWLHICTSVTSARFIHSYQAQVIGKFTRSSDGNLTVEIDSLLLNHSRLGANFTSVWKF